MTDPTLDELREAFMFASHVLDASTMQYMDALEREVEELKAQNERLREMRPSPFPKRWSHE